ncbi:MAG: peptidylprolyl isomerase, partial [Cyclobacteriaceae bacterium]|nr:peptidylprolyl isomerase [Cyclobacteriaceae bacterium]
MSKLKYTLLAFSFILSLNASFAQDDPTSGQVLDKIVAKVDNNIILESDVQRTFIEAIAQSQQGITPPTRCEVFETLLVNKLMVAKAEIDSVIVAPAEVELQTENRFSMVLQQIGGDENMILQMYGKTADQLKSEMYDLIEEQMVVQRMRDKITEGVTVSPAEVRAFFESIPTDSLPFFSAEVTVGQIVKKPEVNEQTKQKIYDQLLGFKEDILAGRADFADLARRYSEDPGSGAQGGDLGFFGRGQLAPEYEATALALRQGEISDPVETQFGFHMIQLLEVRGATY